MNKGNTGKYLKSPELRFFWVFLIIATVLLVADFLYLSPGWIFFHAIALILLGSVIFWSGYHLAKANFTRKTSATRLESIVTNLSDGVIAYDNNFKVIKHSIESDRLQYPSLTSFESTCKSYQPPAF